MNVMIVYANAGGGHRSVALALQEAFSVYHPEARVHLLDVMGDYAPFPMNHFPEIYPQLTKGNGSVWKWIYTLTDGQFQAKVLSEVWNPVIRGRIRRAWMEHSADLVVSVYPLLNRNLGKYLRKLRSNPIFTIMVTDLGTAHYLWFSKYADHYLIPTESVHRRAVEFGVPEHKMTITGLPVSPAFSSRVPKKLVKEELGLAPDLPVALLVGGADGMGGIEAIAHAIDTARPRGQMVVIAGRNVRLQERLSSVKWHIPVRVIGFTDEMHRWMQASDLLLSKAGPSTISEALAVGLPVLLTGYLPGQEEANLRFVVDSGAGVYQPRPDRIAGLVRSWFSAERYALEQMAANARKAARPNAAKDAVDLLCGLVSSHNEPRTYRMYNYPLHVANNS